MNVDVLIDEFIPCLRDRVTGQIMQTKMSAYKPKAKEFENWNFDWTIPEKSNFEVYALTLESDRQVQGLIALKDEPDNVAIHLDIVETAPHNFGSQGKYKGVGGHLFAFAGKKSIDVGYNFVYFEAKTNLIEYYTKELGAKQVGSSQLMCLEGKQLFDLVNTYYGGDDNA